MTNVLYIFGGEKASGAEIVIKRLINSNPSVEAHLFVAPGNFASQLRAESPKYPITILNDLKKLNRSNSNVFIFYLRAVLRFFTIPLVVYKYIKNHNIHIIHANTVVPASYLIPLIICSRFILDLKVLWIWSDHDIEYFKKLDHILARLCVVFYDYTLAVSKAVTGKFPSNKKVIVLYNGLNLDQFKPDINLRDSFRNIHRIDKHEIVIGLAAIISPRKGQLRAIKAFNIVQRNKVNVRLLLAGDFTDDDLYYGHEVNDLIKENAGITYLGKVNDMASFYNGCDIIINNSSHFGSEPLGTTIYEAMACGKIVLASNTGGTPEIITSEVDGYLFEPDNEIALAQTISNAIANSNKDVINKNAVKKVKTKFAIDLMVKNYNKIISNIG